MTVTQLMATMPSWELTEWAGYWKIRSWEQEVGKSTAEFT